MIGQTISHYKILDKLGEGGMGVVYLAEDVRLGRRVALKFLPPEATAREEDRRRFEQEARAAARLNHPNICTIHHFDEYEGTPFLVMEYVEGTTLRERLREGALPAKEAIGYAVQIAEALARAHDAGVVHRDIKPGNIMVTAEGRVKVMDFGLAKLRGVDPITRTGSTVGTMAYMAPEQIQGREVDHRADIFAFGVVLFEMLTGVRPFHGEHQAALVYSIVNEEPASIRSYLMEAPEELGAIFDRMLAKDLSERFGSASELVQDLEAVEEISRALPKNVEAIAADGLSTASTENADSGSSSTTISITLPGGGFWEISVGRIGLLLGAAIVLAMVSLASWWVWPSTGEASHEPELVEAEEVAFSDLVAVMAFENRTGDPELEHVGMMAADWIAQGLQRTELVRVVPPETAVQLVNYGDEREERDDGLDARTLADRADVGTVITGAVYRRGDDLEIHTRLIDVRTAMQVAVLDPIRGGAQDPMEVVDAVRQRVMSLVVGQFDEELDFLMTLDTVPKYEAYRDYVEGLRLFVGWQDFEAALPYFQRSYEEDPAFLQSLMFQAYSHLNLGDVARADSLFERLDEESAHSTRQMRALSELGLATTKGQLERVYQAGREAHDLIPGNYAVIYMAGHGAKRVNRPHEAVEVLAQADPEVRVGGDGPAAGSWISYWIVLGESLHMTEQYADELEAVDRAEVYHPETFRLIEAKARALVGMDRLDDLEDFLQQHTNLPEDAHGETYGGLLRLVGRELRAHGFEAESQAMLERSLSWYEEQSGEPFPGRFANPVAQTLYELGRWDEAAALFGQLVDEAPDNLDHGGHLGVAAAMMGDRPLAEHIDRSLADLEHPYLFGRETQWRVRIAAALGEEARAIALLEQAFSEGLPYGTWLHVDRVLTTLEDHPDYRELAAVRG